MGTSQKNCNEQFGFFLERGRKISRNVFEEKYRSLAIPKGVLEIMLEVELKIEDKKRKIIERFQVINENDYQNNDNIGDYSIYDMAVLNQMQTQPPEVFCNKMCYKNPKNLKTKKKTILLMIKKITFFVFIECKRSVFHIF